MNNRAGHYEMQLQGYQSFVPNPLPPNPPIAMDDEMLYLLSTADRKLGRLDGITEILPNPDLFVKMYVKKEAILSSQIEGTQASFIDVLKETKETQSSDENVRDVVNYVDAMNYGLSRLTDLPLSLRLLREIHSVLLQSGRGSKKIPGEFRKTQNWIGAPGCSLHNAAFVPPSVPDMLTALDNLEKFLHSETPIPDLIKIGIIHAQFETIHPFLDGNGRMGRLLITFWLCYKNILKRPLLYLSYYFKQHRSDYYDYLMDVRNNGNWENWIKFFLKGIASVSEEAVVSARKIIDLKIKLSKILENSFGNNTTFPKLLDLIFDNPILSKNDVKKILGISYPTANSAIDAFCKINILKDMDTSKKRYKQYKFVEYIDILNEGTDIL